MRPPFFDVTFPDAINFGSIGAIFGHELAHGFTTEGLRHDRDGNIKQWLNEASNQYFELRFNCLIDQYSKYIVKGHSLDGKRTLGNLI